MKKAIIASLLMALGCCGSAYAYRFEVGGLYFEHGYADDECWLVSNVNDPYSGKVNVPATIQYEGRTMRVVSILDGAFRNCEHLTSITLNEGLERINHDVFYNCTALKTVVIPNSVTLLGSDCFYGCKDLKEATIGSGVTEIPHGMFEECSSLEKVNMPNTITRIESDAFLGCIAMPEFVIPESVIYLGSVPDSKLITSLTLPDNLEFFGGASHTSIREIRLPRNITTVNFACFYECEELERVYAASPLVEVQTAAFAGCGKLVEIPSLLDVELVGSSAFQNCTSLKRLIFSNKLKSIGEHEYGGESMGIASSCSCLEEVDLGGSITELPRQCFWHCTSLKSITIPESCKIIGAEAFGGCSALEKVKMPARMECLGEEGRNGVFKECGSLKSIVVPEGIVDLPKGSFGYCYALEHVSLPSTLRTIGGYCFAECGSLDELELPDGLAYIGGAAFSGLDALKRLVIPASVKEISEVPGAPVWLSSKSIEELVFADGPDEMEYSAGISQLSAVKSLHFGRNIRLKDDMAGLGNLNMDNVESITIGEYVTDATYVDFSYAWRLKSLISIPTVPPAVGEFYPSLYDNLKPTIDSTALQAYKNAPNWKKFHGFSPQEGLNAIDETDFSPALAAQGIYSVNGLYLGASFSGLPSGIYVVRQGKQSYKVFLR